MRTFLFSCVLLTSTIVAAQQYDVVLEGGRVMDPETGFDGVRNVGISGERYRRLRNLRCKDSASFMLQDSW